jgi:hypothetical protein
MISESLFAILLKFQERFFPFSDDGIGTDETNSTCDGNLSDTVTFTAVEGPLLVAMSVYSIVSPVFTSLESAIFMMEMSARIVPSSKISVATSFETLLVSS